MIRPLIDFLRLEAAGGIVLIGATVLAVLWANSPWQDTYEELWETSFTVVLGSHRLDLSLREWINDGLMAIFFLVVGLEVKRELVEGELRTASRAALPAVAALGGMVVPALIYGAFNAGTDALRGWAIPTATDIAMAVGVLSLFGSRVPSALKVFLLALAIVDDIGAILIIAVFYADGIQLDALATAAVLLLAAAALRRLGVRAVTAYVALGAAVWLALHQSGVNPTLAGVMFGLLTPAHPARQRELIDTDALADISTVQAARETAALARDSVSVIEWLEHFFHPWTTFLIVPLFALANAGVPLGAGAIADTLSTRTATGIFFGLVVGKLVGISAFAWIGTRIGICKLPDGATWPGMLGVAALGGIGFTVSIFITDLAFEDTTLQAQATVAILLASLAAATIAASILLATTTSSAQEPQAG